MPTDEMVSKLHELIAFATTEEIRRLRSALDESVKLQSHQARLLNQYDGGERKEFADGDAWIARLEECGHYDEPA
jgi:hypothetical protein